MVHTFNFSVYQFTPLTSTCLNCQGIAQHGKCVNYPCSLKLRVSTDCYPFMGQIKSVKKRWISAPCSSQRPPLNTATMACKANCRTSFIFNSGRLSDVESTTSRFQGGCRGKHPRPVSFSPWAHLCNLQPAVQSLHISSMLSIKARQSVGVPLKRVPLVCSNQGQH